MSILRVPEPKQTSFGSMLFYNENNKTQRIEFATDEEAKEFADMLREEREKYENAN